MCYSWEASQLDEDIFPLSAVIWVPGRIPEELSSCLQAGLMGFAPVPVAMEKVLDSFNTSVRISPWSFPMTSWTGGST